VLSASTTNCGAPVPLPPVFDTVYSFTSKSSVASLLSSTSAALRTYYHSVASSLNPSKPRVSGVFYHKHAPVSFNINVFCQIDEGETGEGNQRIVEVQRRHGDVSSFHTFYIFLLSEMTRAGHLSANVNMDVDCGDMDSMSPPSLDDDDELEQTVREMWTTKASSNNHKDAREGLRGLLASSIQNDDDLMPIVHRALDNQHDIEQYRLAIDLLDTALHRQKPPTSDLLLPVLSSLFSTSRDTPFGYETLHLYRSMLHSIDAMSYDAKLSSIINNESEVIDHIRENINTTAVKV